MHGWPQEWSSDSTGSHRSRRGIVWCKRWDFIPYRFLAWVATLGLGGIILISDGEKADEGLSWGKARRMESRGRAETQARNNSEVKWQDLVSN